MSLSDDADGFLQTELATPYPRWSQNLLYTPVPSKTCQMQVEPIIYVRCSCLTMWLKPKAMHAHRNRIAGQSRRWECMMVWYRTWQVCSFRANLVNDDTCIWPSYRYASWSLIERSETVHQTLQYQMTVESIRKSFPHWMNAYPWGIPVLCWPSWHGLGSVMIILLLSKRKQDTISMTGSDCAAMTILMEMVTTGVIQCRNRREARLINDVEYFLIHIWYLDVRCNNQCLGRYRSAAYREFPTSSSRFLSRPCPHLPRHPDMLGPQHPSVVMTLIMCHLLTPKQLDQSLPNQHSENSKPMPMENTLPPGRTGLSA